MKNHFSSILTLVLFLAISMPGVAQKLRTVQQIEGIPPKIEYRAITHDPDGNIYVATSVDVFMIPANSNIAQPMKAGDEIMDVDWSKDYGLIMLHKKGVVQFVATGKELVLDAGGNARCMDLTHSVVWVGTENGVYTVSIPKETVIDHFTTDNSELQSNQINFIHTDPFGVRWIGTKGGVIRIEREKWKLYEKDHNITAITSTSEGAWMAADDMMWLVNSFNRWYPIDAWKDLVDGNVKALAADGKGILYIASDKLVKYDPYQERIVAMNEGGINEQTIILDQGPGRNVWMAGHNGMSKVMEDTTKVASTPTLKQGQMEVGLEVRSTPVCEGMATGHLEVIEKGGVPPITYKWGHNNLNAPEATQLTPGLYQVTVTDAEGKSIVSSAIIPASPAMSLLVSAGSKSSDKLATDGKASVTIKGGLAPYAYQWSDGEKTAQATQLPEGLHTIRVIDANGCIATGNVTIEADKVLKSLDITTITLGQTIGVDKLYFQADSSAIEPASYPVLQEIYDFLHSNKNVAIEIGGHTNSLPTDEYCDKLSTDRARNIAEYLYAQGIPPSQISYKGYGKRQPIASNATVEGRKRNQRVEIKIISL